MNLSNEIDVRQLVREQVILSILKGEPFVVVTGFYSLADNLGNKHIVYLSPMLQKLIPEAVEILNIIKTAVQADCPEAEVEFELSKLPISFSPEITRSTIAAVVVIYPDSWPNIAPKITEIVDRALSRKVIQL